MSYALTQCWERLVLFVFWLFKSGTRGLSPFLIATTLLCHGTSAIAQVGSNASLAKGWDFVLHSLPATGEEWLEDANDPMCQKIKAYMNKSAPSWVREGNTLLMNRCTSAVRLAPFFSEPPWEELDPRRHEELIVRLLRFSHNQAEYFRAEPSTPGFDENHFQKLARDFIETGGRLQHWKARLKESFYFPADGNDKPAPPGDQDVIQLRYPNDYRKDARYSNLRCRLPNWFGSVFLVDEDLSGPLRYLDSMSGQSLLIYDGDPVLDNSSGYEISVSSPFNSRSGHSCRLTYPDHKLTPTRNQRGQRHLVF